MHIKRHPNTNNTKNKNLFSNFLGIKDNDHIKIQLNTNKDTSNKKFNDLENIPFFRNCGSKLFAFGHKLCCFGVGNTKESIHQSCMVFTREFLRNLAPFFHFLEEISN